MLQRKFILFSILKTWLMATVISTVILVIYMMITEVPSEHPRNCDMSGLAYGLLIFWILSLSVISFSSLFSLLKVFQGKGQRWLCWFLLPTITAGYFLWKFLTGRLMGKGLHFS